MKLCQNVVELLGKTPTNQHTDTSTHTPHKSSVIKQPIPYILHLQACSKSLNTLFVRAKVNRIAL